MNVIRNTITAMQALSFTRQDLCFGKYFKAVNRFGTIVLGCTFRLIYHTLDTNKGTMSVRSYCLEKLKWSNTTFNKTFNTSEREILEKSPTSDDFVCDVSLLFKIIMNVIGNEIEPIKKDIRELKNLRNAVCHEDLQMDEEEMKRRLLVLKGMCRSILRGIIPLLSQADGMELVRVVMDMDSDLRRVMEVKLEVDDRSSYLEDLLEFRQKKTSKMISEGRKELMSYYSKVTVLNPCPWLNDNRFSDFTVEKTFTTLRLQESGNIVPMNEILNLSELKQRFVPQLVIVSGVMGAGKTSLYRFLIHEWCSRSPVVTGLSEADIVIGIEMRSLSCGSLVQFLREQLLKDTCRLFSENDIVPVLQEVCVVFIIDGMDEATRQGRAVLKEIISKFTNSTVIVTTRLEFTLDLKKLADEHIVLQLEGFEPEDQDLFAKKVFTIKYPDETRRQREIKAFLEYKSSMCASVTSHLSLPLNLALLLVLWCDDLNKATTVTTTTRLYSKIYEMSQQKLMLRLESEGVGHSASLSLKVKRCMLELGRVAWNMIVKESLCLTQECSNNIMEFCEREGIDPINTLSTFLNSETRETLIGTVCHFSFHHSSSQEFLAALYISEETAKSGSLFPILKDIDNPRFQEVVMYITGLLKLKEILTQSLADEIIQVLCHCSKNQLNDPLLLSRLIQEAESDPEICKIVGSIISKNEYWVINSWDPVKMTEAKLMLLREAKVAPAMVVIYIQYTKRLEECPELVEIITHLGEENKSRVKIIVDRQFQTVGEQEQIDQFIVPLLRSNTLLEVTGHIGNVFASELVTATNLESLSVRITSLETLTQLSLSIKKPLHWKTVVMPSKKWSPKFLELFLDITPKTQPSDVPCIHYQKDLVLKMAGIADATAKWAGEVVHKLNKRYASVTLQESSVSIVGLKHFLKATENSKIKLVRVMSDNLSQGKVYQVFPTKRGTKINLGKK